MVQPIGTYIVVPALPPSLQRLRDLAYNVYWSWDHDQIDLFRRLGDGLWSASGHNPVRLLGMISQERLDQLAADDAFVAHLDRVWAGFERYITWRHTWYSRLLPNVPRPLVAYFSMEYGLTEALPIYSGGLGILAGDHLKSASDLGVDIVGVGLLYQEGYFRQRLNVDGWQEEYYPVNDFSQLPVLPETAPDGSPLTVSVDLPGRQVTIRVWRVNVGRLALYMLDTNDPTNLHEDQPITDRLYGGDLDMRIRQEIVLGMGGLRALARLGVRPDVCHLNEGHSGFMILDRIRMLMQERHLSFAQAREVARAGTVFTTHTPVPAGIDRFPPYMMERYFAAYCQEVGISVAELMALGREHQFGDTAVSRGACSRSGGPPCPLTRCPLRPSPTVCTSYPSSPMRSPSSTSATSGRAGARSRAISRSGPRQRRYPRKSCGAPTSVAVSAWSLSCVGACAIPCAARAQIRKG